MDISLSYSTSPAFTLRDSTSITSLTVPLFTNSAQKSLKKIPMIKLELVQNECEYQMQTQICMVHTSILFTNNRIFSPSVRIRYSRQRDCKCD
jgi:hypothetical protein